ncbi:MAG: hypothetical protein RQ752_08640 [Thermohalobaculum sp.]|nr:hypothetical protein [Thermohalobaculum sp.]
MTTGKHLLLGAAMLVQAAGFALADTVVIGHFGNPTPVQVARMDAKFEAATGWDIEWRTFAAGSEVIAAMASGDIKLAEPGSSPLAIAASQWVDLQLFMLAQVIGEAESLIVCNGSGIAALEDLKGRRVAVPVGSTAHFSLMGALSLNARLPAGPGAHPRHFGQNRFCNGRASHADLCPPSRHAGVRRAG